MAQMMWVWHQERFHKLECPNRLDRMLVAAGLSPSVAEATRLIKQGSVRWRRDYEDAWEQIRNPRATLAEGWPWEISVGRGPIRMLAREGRDGWDCYRTRVELMLPLAHQGLRSWTDIMRRGRVAWWPYCLDRWEHFCEDTLGMDRSPTTGPKES